jgi:hypothetical protein
MHRIDNSRYLLYIEPKVEDKLKYPIDDSLTETMNKALSESQEGTAPYYSDRDNDGTINGKVAFRGGSGYKGSHRTECGEISSNKDYLLKNGMITNSLSPFYLRWYRYSIPESEMLKVKELEEFYKNK